MGMTLLMYATLYLDLLGRGIRWLGSARKLVD